MNATSRTTERRESVWTTSDARTWRPKRPSRASSRAGTSRYTPKHSESNENPAKHRFIRDALSPKETAGPGLFPPFAASPAKARLSTQRGTAFRAIALRHPRNGSLRSYRDLSGCWRVDVGSLDNRSRRVDWAYLLVLHSRSRCSDRSVGCLRGSGRRWSWSRQHRETQRGKALAKLTCNSFRTAIRVHREQEPNEEGESTQP